jgi:hypothetical protein
MTDWPYSRIENHIEQATDRLTSQYKDTLGLVRYIEVIATRVQVLEDAIYTLLTDRWLENAEGVQLDRMGQIIGELRSGRNDETYLSALQTRITLNISGGEPERVIDYLVRVFGAEDVRYKEVYPAKIQVFVGSAISFGEAQNLRRIVPAAVGTIYVEETGGFTPFSFSELTQSIPDNVEGFAELEFYDLELSDGTLLELSDGDTLGVTDKNDPLKDETEGGVLAELIEV